MSTQSAFSRGNQAFRAGHFAKAIAQYVAALQQTPALGKMIAANLAQASQKYRSICTGSEKPRAAVCGCDLAQGSAGRVYTLAMLYETFADVEIIGCLFRNRGLNLWKPIGEASIVKHVLVVENENKFLDQAIQLVTAHPYDIVHLSKPKAPNVFFGILYKLIWDAQVLMDIDDEELALVGEESAISIDDYINRHGQLPAPTDLLGREWTRLAVGLAKDFDGVTVCNSTLQQRYGGEIIRHAQDERRFNFPPELKAKTREKYAIPQDKKVILFFGTPPKHTGLIETAQAIASLGRPEILLCIAGELPGPNLKKELEDIEGCCLRFLPDQPFNAVPELLSIADCCFILQDIASKIAQLQTPAELSDALLSHIPVLCYKSNALEDFESLGAIILVTPQQLSTSAAQFIDRAITAPNPLGSDRRTTEFLGLGANAEKLKQIAPYWDKLAFKLNLLLAKCPDLSFLSQLSACKVRKIPERATLDKLSDPSSSEQEKCAIVCHVFYEELFEDVTYYIDNAGADIKLYFSIPEEKSCSLKPKIARRYPAATIRTCKNQGSDIYPFLEILQEILENTKIKIVCKIHTKSGSTQYPDVWREVLLNGVLGSPGLIASIVNQFMNNDSMGMAGPASLFKSNLAMIYGNQGNIERLAQLADCGDLPKDWPFFAGTMFWSRVDILIPLIQLMKEKKISWVGHQADGNDAHAIERMFGLFVVLNKKHFCLVHNEALNPIDSSLEEVLDNSIASSETPSASLSNIANDFRQYISVRRGGAFDVEFYRSEYSNSEKQHYDPLMHYVKLGAPNGNYPNAMAKFMATASLGDIIRAAHIFDEGFYLAQYQDVKDAGGKALDHYIRFGNKKRDPSALFSSAWYRETYRTPDDRSPLVDYLTCCANNIQRDPHPLFSSKWYREKYIMGTRWSVNPLGHYLAIGRVLGYQPHPTFRSPKNNLKIASEYYPNSSPVISRVPPTVYLLAYSKGKPRLQREKYSTLEEYINQSATHPRLITASLTENDMRVIGVMDNYKNLLARKYSELSVVELVSVIMPTKNRSDKILIAISSVLNQSHDNWELILVDDGSEDNTRDVISLISDSRIKYIRLDRSIGNAGARNRGLAASKGTLIAFLDDDDQWDPEFLLVSINYLRERKAKMIYSAQVVWEGFDPTIQLGIKFSFIRFAQYNRALLENSNYISMISCVIDRSVYQEHEVLFDESLERLVDWDYFLRVTETCVPIALPCLLSHYFVGHTQRSVSKSFDREKCLLEVRNRLMKRAGGSKSVKIPCYKGDLLIHPPVSRPKVSDRTARTITNIIIPNYECYEELVNCIQSIELVTTMPYRVIVVDNNSSAQARSKIIKIPARFKHSECIMYDEFRGFSYAVNAGLELVFRQYTGDVLILNNDTYVTKGWLEQLQWVLTERADVGMVVPRQVLPPSHEVSKHHSPDAIMEAEVDINLSAHHRNVVDARYDEVGGLFELNYAPMFCSLIRRDIADRIGYLDAGNGPHFRSDWIYCNAVRFTGRSKIVYTPYSKVYHLQGIATAKL
jgi:GT2 family glycosyltransferase